MPPAMLVAVVALVALVAVAALPPIGIELQLGRTDKLSG